MPIQQMDIKEIKTHGFERVVHGYHEQSNFSAYIAIHTLENGPAFGGIRYFNYKDNQRPYLDVQKLSEAMTEKCMVSGIKLSGGKTVVQQSYHKDIGAFGVDEKRIYPYLGELINYLNGDYYGGLDVGFNFDMLQNLRRYTDFTTTYSDPDIGSSCTAFGVYNAMKAGVKFKLEKDSLNGLKIAIKGIGKVGYQLANYVLDDGATLIVADKNDDKIQYINDLQKKYPFKIEVVDHNEIHKKEVDIYSPCAMGNDIRVSRISNMNCKIICGAANNQLDVVDPLNAKQQLLDHKILYVPDTIANAGGVFRSAGVILKSRDEQESFKLITTIYDRTLSILDMASTHRISPADVCTEIGQAIKGKPNRFKQQLDGLSGVKVGNNTYKI
jgi:leucine dehydrogenase